MLSTHPLELRGAFACHFFEKTAEMRMLLKAQFIADFAGGLVSVE